MDRCLRHARDAEPDNSLESPRAPSIPTPYSSRALSESMSTVKDEQPRFRRRKRTSQEACWARKHWPRLNATPGTNYSEEVLALTQTQLAAALAEKTDMSNAEAKRVLTALEEVVLDQIGNAEKVRIGGLVQLTVRMKPASKARKGRNPATGEEITISAKPASVDLRARPLAKAKEALPSVQKARRRLAK
jgi:DNA-binding protein HU-beta